jgi:hypothetical protein
LPFVPIGGIVVRGIQDFRSNIDTKVAVLAIVTTLLQVIGCKQAIDRTAYLILEQMLYPVKPRKFGFSNPP